MFEITLAGRPSAARRGAGRVPDLGQVAELDPGISPRASNLWSQSPVAIGSSATIRSRCPSAPVESRQLPYPPGGPGPPAAVNVNPGPSLAAGFRRFASFPPWGRAHPWPMACPCSSVTVTHQLDRGLRAAARARSRASQGSTGPIPAISPGRSASPVRVASGIVRVIRPANPAGITPPWGPPGAAPALVPVQVTVPASAPCQSVQAVPGRRCRPARPSGRSSHAGGILRRAAGDRPGSGRRRMNSATAACLRAAMCASSRSHAQITPATSSSEAQA